MGRIVSTTYMSLDGDISNVEAWHFDYVGNQAAAAASAQLATADALILGRKTYEGFAPAWTAMKGENDFADRMNTMPKFVASTTLTDLTWENSRVIGDDLVSEIRELKENHDLLQYGFGDVTRLMLANGLLDEVRIWLHPVLSGNATPSELIYRDIEQTRFTLNGTEVHDTGLIILSYTPTLVAG